MKESNESLLTLSREEMHALAKKRISEITREFTEGFNFLEDYPKSVTFFGGNQLREDDKYYISARALAAKLVKELGYSIISGGGPGIMEAANRGAYEAGGSSLGLLIKLPDGQITNKYITAEFSAYYFFVRKVCLTFSAEAFIFFPGGFGTLDEFFEIATLVQTKKVEGVPIICVGSDYWNAVKEFMKKELQTRGTVTESDLKLFHITDDHDEIVEMLKKVPVRFGVPLNGKKLG